MLLLRHVFYPTNNLCCSALRSELDALAPEIVVKGKPIEEVSIEEVHMDELRCLLKSCKISPKFSIAFAKSGRFQLPKNGISDAETKKQRPLFNANYPQKW